MKRRNSLPETLERATEFSAQEEFYDPLWVIRTLNKHPNWLAILLDGTNLSSHFGRPRQAGHWALAYLAFTVSNSPDIEPWLASSDDRIWAECGFQHKPPYATVWRRFAELERVDASNAFVESAGELIQHARKKSGGKVGSDIHVDGSEAETNARLIHDCRPGSGCRRAKYPERAHTDDAQADRHKRDKAAPKNPDKPDYGDAEEVRIEDGQIRLKVGGCWYRSRDTSAGIRAYTRDGRLSKFWHGFLNNKAIDHFTGAPIAVLVTSASEQEFKTYPNLLARVKTALGGEVPRAMVSDRGLSFKNVFQENSENGIATVIPYRKARNRETRIDTDRYDRHGIPRCKGCGGPTTYYRFTEKPKPRVSFHCQTPLTEKCKQEQSLYCSSDWRTVIPMWRTQEAYFALKLSHAKFERVHRLWKDRYRVGATTHELRPKRMGIGWQQLRANAALLVEWLRILSREGWIGAHRTSTGTVKPETIGKKARGKFLKSRHNAGLNGQYGKYAVEAGTGRAQPLKANRSGSP